MYRNEPTTPQIVFFSITLFFQKFFQKVNFGHLFLSIFRFLKKVLKKCVKNTHCDDNGNKYEHFSKTM